MLLNHANLVDHRHFIFAIHIQCLHYTNIHSLRRAEFGTMNKTMTRLFKPVQEKCKIISAEMDLSPERVTLLLCARN